jgi:hypothetical protein
MSSLQFHAEAHRGHAGAYPRSLARLERRVNLAVELPNPFTDEPGVMQLTRSEVPAYAPAEFTVPPSRAYLAWRRCRLPPALALWHDLVGEAPPEIPRDAGKAIYVYLGPRDYRVYGTDEGGHLIRRGKRPLAYAPLAQLR